MSWPEGIVRRGADRLKGAAASSGETAPCPQARCEHGNASVRSGLERDRIKQSDRGWRFGECKLPGPVCDVGCRATATRLSG